VTEEAVRRYLTRKPMTAVELLQKFKSKNTGMSKSAMLTTIANIVKKLNPEQTKVKNKMYLFIKKKD
jgi:transcription initiation factor TFIIF subunit alpha